MAQSFFTLACSRNVVIRALKIALVVGTLLILINHGQALLNFDMSITRWIQIALTYCVPYAVSTYSSVQALRQST